MNRHDNWTKKWSSLVRDWKALNRPTKLAIGLLIIVAAVFAPELTFLLDLGGLELAFLAIVHYFKPTWLYLKNAVRHIGESYRITFALVSKSPLIRPRIFITSAILSLLLVSISGFWITTSTFFLPLVYNSIGAA